MQLHRQCLVCESEQLRQRYALGTHTIVECAACSMVFVQEWYTQDELGPYYNLVDDDFIYTDQENIDNLSFYYRQLRDVIQTYQPTGTILDIGCSGGEFLDVMDGWDRYGVELSTVIAAHAQQRYGDHVFAGTIEDVPFPKASFAVVTLQDSLDHMIDPRDVLRRCYDFLQPGGLLVVKVHDIGSLFARLSGPRYYALIPPYHLSYFNRRSLRVILERTGFAVETFRYLPHQLQLKTVPYRLARGRTSGPFYALYQWLSRAKIGRIAFKKNLFDIVTVFARKPAA